MVFPDNTWLGTLGRAEKKVNHMLETGWGAYLYILEGGPVEVNGIHIPELGAAKIEEEEEMHFEAKRDAELLLVEVLLA